ncbi:glycerophosphodiester phosphodiesterase [Corynebacterium fournieri]|uniref:glycerophosphodiester phosphodiesterase n=1 Tax=Corynebacterium fournieri TaxID=1852390 RepID=UPI000A2EE788|nr:glycerophosphodiester phosphodiesterase family protein [Corynebacterium fournieri]WJY98507.1 putative glycerophosphoryl diester phosphodiesterase 1 [Corynebacterium fournieri]
MTGIIAHRGFNGLYPENTRRAFEEALKLDIAGIECDVNLSKDGQVVVIHDLTVDRTSNGSGEVAQLLVDDLKQLNIGTDDDPQEIMLLDELLDLLDEYPGKHILIETKHLSPFGAELEEAVAHVLRARGMEADERVHLISFNPEAIERFQHLLPAIETFLLVDEPFVQVGDCSAGPSVREAKAHPELFDGQLRTYVWTVNLPRDMEWLHQHGATLIGTDLPHIALQTLS